MRFDLANLPTDTATLHQIIAAQAAEGEAREAELAAARAGWPRPPAAAQPIQFL
jgi:hypothetical protein